MFHVLVLLEGSWIFRASSIEHLTYYFRQKVISSTWHQLAFKLKLAGKAESIEVEVIDAPLDYNLLLGRSWTYAMSTIASVVLRVVVFPHEGKLVTVDRLSFTQKGRMETNESTMPLVD